MRDISLIDKIFLWKVISRLIYHAYTIAISNRAIKKLNWVNLGYIWKQKTHYIKRVELTKYFKDGGLQVIDFDYKWDI